MRGINIFEQAHVVNALAAINVTGGASSDIFNMKNHRFMNAIIALGITASAPTSIVLNACSDNTGAGREAIPFRYYREETSGGDTFGNPQKATAAGITDVSANDNIMYGLFIDAAELPDGKPWVEIRVNAPAASILGSIMAILTGEGYSGAGTDRSVLT